MRYSRVFRLVAGAALLAGCDADHSSPSNAPPTAVFTSECDDLACSFSNGSSDSDGTIEGYDWDFGDQSAHVTTRHAARTYIGPGGRFTVTLSVTDNDGETATASRQVDVSAAASFPPVPAGALIYVRVSERDRGTVSRYVLYEGGTFALQQVTARWGFSETTGRYARVNASISLDFDANQPQWQATATIQGDSLIVDYNPTMELDDFEDGVYRLAPTPGLGFTIAARSVITQSAPLNTMVGAPPSVLVRDGSGTPVAGMTITFAVTSGGGTVLPAMPVVTDASGIAAVESWTLGATQGANTLSATATGSDIAGNPVLFAATGLAFTQQGLKLIGTGAAGAANQGYSVSLSADGGTAIVGGFADNGDVGAAWVWTRSGGVWTQQGSKLVGTGAVGAANQGYSVSLSADGNTAIVGGVLDNDAAGAAWIWTRSGDVWTQQGSKLVGTGAVGNAYQGLVVSLSADGNTAIVGGFGDNGDAGAAWVWTRSGNVWTQQGSKLVGSGAVGAAQGISVSLSADGNTAIVGGSYDNGSAGAAWVWTRSGGVWTQQGPKLVGSGAVGNADQGYSVSLSADGNTAIVGGDADNGGAGAVWVWTRSGGVWTQQGSKLVGSGAVGSSGQGIVVSLSADGNAAIIGGYDDNGSAGAAWFWTRSGGVWTQQGSKLVGTGAVGVANQGISVSLSADGNTAMVGGSSDNANAGAAWVFTRP